MSVRNDIDIIIMLLIYSCHNFTSKPTILPKVAPIAIEGTKIPQGTFAPYVTIVPNNEEA